MKSPEIPDPITNPNERDFVIGRNEEIALKQAQENGSLDYGEVNSKIGTQINAIGGLHQMYDEEVAGGTPPPEALNLVHDTVHDIYQEHLESEAVEEEFSPAVVDLLRGIKGELTVEEDIAARDSFAAAMQGYTEHDGLTQQEAFDRISQEIKVEIAPGLILDQDLLQHLFRRIATSPRNEELN